MAHNESARQRAAQGCPECGADGRDVVARTVEKVYGGEDWERVECSACGWSRTM